VNTCEAEVTRTLHQRLGNFPGTQILPSCGPQGDLGEHLCGDPLKEGPESPTAHEHLPASLGTSIKQF
jgi:hypothetical protein